MEKVVNLYNENKWRDIIELLNNCDIENSRQLLWVSPNFKNLSWIKNIICETNLKGIVSVGCGSGLLEWLIQQNCGKDNCFFLFLCRLKIFRFIIKKKSHA